MKKKESKIKKIWKWIFRLFVSWMVCMSAVSILRASYIICFLTLLCLYIWISIWILCFLYNIFAKEEWERDYRHYTINWWQFLIIIIVALILIWWLRLINETWYFQKISESVAMRAATNIHMPWEWKIPRVDIK